jgi:hypothetical protein
MEICILYHFILKVCNLSFYFCKAHR